MWRELGRCWLPSLWKFIIPTPLYFVLYLISPSYNLPPLYCLKSHMCKNVSKMFFHQNPYIPTTCQYKAMPLTLTVDFKGPGRCLWIISKIMQTSGCTANCSYSMGCWSDTALCCLDQQCVVKYFSTSLLTKSPHLKVCGCSFNAALKYVVVLQWKQSWSVHALSTNMIFSQSVMQVLELK